MNPQSLITAFSVWAAVVGLIGTGIVWELMGLRKDVRQIRDSLAEHAIEVQGRLTAVETHLRMRDGFTPTQHFGLK